jgi:hypothetical protein
MQKTKSPFVAVAASAWWPKILLGLMCISPAAVQAAPYNLTWTGTVVAGDDPNPPGVASGDLFDFTFTVDNGDASSFLQTWGEGDFVKATINVNNGVYIGTKSTIDLGGSSGAFQTDALGNVVAVPSWHDFFTGNPYSDSLGNNEANSGLGGYFINGSNQVWVINTPANPGGDRIEISASDVATNQVPAEWSVSAVPEPSTLVLALLSLISLGFQKRMR